MIILGPGGTSGLGYEAALAYYKRAGLQAMEVEFTYGVRMSVADAKHVGQLAKKLGIRLSVHAPYYINLVSKDSSKVRASRKRILDSCSRAHYLGAKYVVFHAGFYQGRDHEKVYQMIKRQVMDLQNAVRRHGWRVRLAPEVTGKPSQFGSPGELLRLSQDAGCFLTVDFAHWLARTGGNAGYAQMFKEMQVLSHIHGHFTGIEYTSKGERRHVLTTEREIRSLLGAALAAKTDVTIINESPDPIGDSLKSLRVLKQLKR
jgi:deoxyribonuclease-4